MPYMSDIIELLEMSEPYLRQLSDMLESEHSIEPVLKALISDVQQAIKEYEALQIGHMVRQ